MKGKPVDFEYPTAINMPLCIPLCAKCMTHTAKQSSLITFQPKCKQLEQRHVPNAKDSVNPLNSSFSSMRFFYFFFYFSIFTIPHQSSRTLPLSMTSGFCDISIRIFQTFLSSICHQTPPKDSSTDPMLSRILVLKG